MGKESPDGLRAELRALAELLRDYAKQETVDPIKRAARYVLGGLAGSLLIIVGVFFLSLGGLRGLQELSAFEGNWSFAPYLLITLVLLLLSALALRAIGSKKGARS